MTELRTTRRSEEDLEIIEVKPGKQFGRGVLKDLLPDVETLLFFAKVYELNAAQISRLLQVVFNSTLTDALFGGDHSYDLQDFLVEDIYQELEAMGIDPQEITFAPTIPAGEILPEMWKQLEVEVATSIKAVAEKLDSLVTKMPGKQGSMVFRSMMTMNAKRPTIGNHKAAIHHAPQKPNLVILDDSGSVDEPTVKAIIEDTVALSYEANAHFALVSDTTRHWEPGSYDVDSVLSVAQYSGTHYETLEELLNQDWGVVICIADYDSSSSSKRHLANNCVGHIDTVLDVSLVTRPTFLAECVGQFADEIKPLLIATGVIRSYW